MKMQTDSTVPFFPYPLRAGPEKGSYLLSPHLLKKPLILNQQAAEIMRLADGELNITEIASQIVKSHPVAGDKRMVRDRIASFLKLLAKKDLVWCRKTPLKPMLVGPPHTVFWEITGACNLRCLHCVVSAGKREKRELTRERCLELIHELASYRVRNVAFSGGEPLVHPDFRLLAERVHHLGMAIQVSTNGTLITQEIAGWLRELKADIQVSLDGSTPAIHDLMRPGNQAFDRTLRGIRTLVAAGHNLTIGTVVTKNNLKDIHKIYALAEQLGANRFRLIPFVPRGRGENHSDLEVSPSQMKTLTEDIRQLRTDSRIPITELEFEKMLNRPSNSSTAFNPRRKGCGGALNYATITPTGEVLPCHFFEGVRADSVRSTPFDKVWQCSRFLNYFRQLTTSDLEVSCRSCKWISECAGGCRALNFAKGDFLGKHKGCWVHELNNL